MRKLSRVVVIAALSAASLAGFGTTAHADQPAVYVVKSGDSLSGIASKLKVKLNDLLAANGITITSVILPGQQLQVPGAGGTGGSGGTGATGGTYTVKAGDSLSAIAQRHKVSLSSLLSVNGMTATSLIVPGQALKLPAGAVPPVASQPTTGQTPAAPASATSYVVKAGDSLSAIAQRHGVSLTSLLAANSMTVKSLILPGQTLVLPSGAAAPAAAPTPATPAAPAASGATYTVKAGDSLSGIAQRHNVSLNSLLAANGMTVKSLILPGQSLKLPAGAAPAASPSAPVGGGLATVLAFVQAQLGKPYVFNTSGPDTYDCSGLTKAAYKTIGISLVHQSASQARQGTAVDFMNEAILPGDLVFLATRGNETINHVGIAISATQYIHAASAADGVKVSSMPAKSSIVAVRRFVSA